MQIRQILLLCFFVFAASSSFAQLPFKRETFNNTYTPITVAGGATTITATGAYASSIPIGFTFNYLAQNFVNVGVSKYGYIALGSPSQYSFPEDNIYLFYNSSGSIANVIAPYWDNLFRSNNQPQLLYQTTGSPGSRVFTVQWSMMTSYQEQTAGDPHNFIEFQAVLFEGSNRIEFNYGTTTFTNPNSKESASIGLKGNGTYGGYLDAVTGSSFTYSYLRNSAQNWPHKSFRFTPGAPTPIAGGTYTVGQTGQFESLSEAIATINNAGISGPVTLNLIDSLYDVTTLGGKNVFPLLLGPVPGLSASNPITITSSVNPRIVSHGCIDGGAGGYIIGTTIQDIAIKPGLEPVFGLFGTRYVTLENVRLSRLSSNGNVGVGILLTNTDRSFGTQNTTVRNVGITLPGNFSCTAVYQASFVSAFPNLVTSPNSNNRFEDLDISDVTYGFRLIGPAYGPLATGTRRDTNNVIIGSHLQNLKLRGIQTDYQKSLVVERNIINNSTPAAGFYGVLCNNHFGDLDIVRNQIMGIHSTLPTNSDPLYGISLQSELADNFGIRIRNNFIGDLTGSWNGSSVDVDLLYGININMTTASNGNATIDVDFNSISLNGSSSPGLSSVCAQFGNNRVFYNIRNNIFANYTASQTGNPKHGAIKHTGTTIGRAGSVMDNNLFHVPNAGNGYIARIGSTSHTTLAAWQAVFAQNANSLVAAPPFVNPVTDLHLSSNALNGLGQHLPAVTLDIDGQTRANPPAIGADEFSLPLCTSVDAGVISANGSSFCAGELVTLSAAGASSGNGISYQWQVSPFPGGPYTNVPGATLPTIATNQLPAATYFVVLQATCSNGPLTDLSNEVSFNIHPKPDVTISATSSSICLGQSSTLTASGADTYAWTPGGATTPVISVSPSATTLYTVIGTTTTGGCRDTATQTVAVRQPSFTTQNISRCLTYTWPANGQTYTTSGTHTATLVNAVGCDSVITLNLTINQPSSATQNVSACATYTWPVNGQTYTTSGTRTATLVNAVGCDSVITLNLTINQPSSATQNVSACATYTWPVNGQTYTTSGTRTATLVNAVGCDSVITLNLTINQPSSATQNVSACATYTWPVNGQTYTTSGPRTATLTNAVGCDSVITLNLTINQPSSATQNVNACVTYTWPVNGQTYTTSGPRTATLTNAVGCDSVITLNLTINQPSTATQNVSACVTYTWPVNGQTYTTSGPRTATLVNAVGCDSVITLNLTINQPSAATQNVSACVTYTWPVNGQTYTTSGTRTATLVNAVGCDSVITLNLTINQPSTATQNVSACVTYTWPVNGQTYTTSGTRTATLINAVGCDSVITLNLTINQPSAATQNVSACVTYTWPVNGQTYTTSGPRTATLTNAVGCDSVITLNLTINQPSASTQSATACGSYTWAVNGQTYTTSGPRTATLTNAVGCDSVITLNLTINQPSTSTQNVSACVTYTWPVNGQTYTTSGTRTATLTNAVGCDSVITLNLTINQPSTATQNVSTCQTYTWPVNGMTYTTSGTHTATLVNAAGCDSVITLVLTINANILTSQSATACGSYTWPVNGMSYTASGSYTDTLTSVAGCDSIITLNLTINQPSASTQSATACGSYTWSVNGQTYTTSGPRTATLTNAVGCDSVITLNLTINQASASTQSATACSSYSWSVNGQTYTTSGPRTATLTNAVGCDSVITLNLTINQPSASTQSATACGSYTWSVNGQTYTTSGPRTATLMNAVGCDSVITLNLTINQPSASTQSATACGSYTWSVNGQTYTTSGPRTATLTNAVGCDSVITLNLTINQPSASTQSATACGSYTWSVNGQTYTTSGPRTATLTNAVGCDSVITLNLTINQASASTQSATACGSYTWSVNGQTYTTSGPRTATLTNAVGCDSVITLNLTINQPSASTQSATACGSYTWSVNGQTYTTSGPRTATLTNAVGCDSVITLNLTINQASAATQSATACGSYTWSVNGQTYTTSGPRTATLTNAVGCDSVITLNLTINQPSAATQSATACGSYTWSVNGQTYTTSGPRTATLTNAVGCDSVITLNLTINQPSASTQSATACGSYTWSVNGQTYPTSGPRTATLTNAVGCDSVITLNLTINQASASTQSATACGSYTWSVNGQTYTTSGPRTATLTNAVGCDSVVTLNLTINQPSASTQSATACGSYTWSVNGQTYTTSGPRTATLTNAVGCDSVITLNLTINQPSASTQSATACGSYTWAVNGQTYTTSGPRTATLTNAVGCDSVITLNLTINQPSASTQSATACGSYTWAVNGQTYNTSGTQTATLTNAVGCDSVITLNLVIGQNSSSTQNASACIAYTWPVNGMTYSTSGIYTDTLSSSLGCDSIITLNLVIGQSSLTTQSATACGSYTWPVTGLTYTLSGSYSDTLTNADGCDSIVTLTLVIGQPITATIAQVGNDLVASPAGASYQWIDCNNGNAPIPGATSQTFTLTQDGNYAVIVSQNACSDTSACQLAVGRTEIQVPAVSLYPNPAQDQVQLRSSSAIRQISLTDMSGKVLLVQDGSLRTDASLDLRDIAQGLYLVHVLHDNDEVVVLKLIKR